MRFPLLILAITFGGCEPGSESPPKPKPQAAAGSASDANCIAVRSEYNRIKALLDLSFTQDSPLRPVVERDLAELMNHNWHCFR